MDILLWHKILRPYEMAVDEMLMKFRHLKLEYQLRGEYCPIEQVLGRVKSVSSILDKVQRKQISMEDMEEKIEDIAGIRIICQFVEDIYRVSSVISSRSDMRVTEVKDYIRNQKESGYRSYHLIVLYTVQTLDGPRDVQVEIQIRTMAMDFWATVEHSLQYKYQGKIPEKVDIRLSGAAEAIISLENEMSSVRNDIMDAQLSSKLRYNLVEDIIETIEKLYQYTTRREVEKVQDEFYRVYKTNDMEELIRYHSELDRIAQAYRIQSNRHGEGVKIIEN